MRWFAFAASVLVAVVPAFAAEHPARPGVPLRTLAAAPAFVDAYLAPELARQTEAFRSYVGSPSYGLHREAGSNGYFETVEGIERNTIRAVRRAARDWLVEATGAERFTLTFRPFAEAVERAGERLTPGNSGDDTQIRLGFSRLYPRVTVERPFASGAFRFAATLDGRAEADFKPDSRFAPTVGAEWDRRERTARFRLGLAF
jgi:hypothetical protein